MRVVRMHGNAYQALLALESLSLDDALVSVRVSRFLNCDLGLLTGVLEDLKTVNPTEELAAFADRFRHAFSRLQKLACTCCQRLGETTRVAFRRMGGILYCLFRRAASPRAAALAATVGADRRSARSDQAFRVALLDRLADGLRALFAWLRDLCRRVESLDALPQGPVPLGTSAARFVVTADTSQGVLVLRFQDGHQELFNLTAAHWRLLLPLLTTSHPDGYARLAARPQSILTRHDANGDELEGDLKRLKSYIHPVGRGRGGNGLYFLAPYPRRLNTVDA